MSARFLASWFSICRHAQFLALVPVPFRNLVWRHSNFLRNAYLHRIRPIRILIEELIQNFHLLRFFPHASAILPLFHVVFFKGDPHFDNFILITADYMTILVIVLEGKLAYRVVVLRKIQLFIKRVANLDKLFTLFLFFSLIN